MNYLNIKSAVIRAAVSVAVAVFVVGGLAAVNAQSNCITFESPLAGFVIRDTTCIISLNVECLNVVKVDLQVRYIPEHSDSPIIASLGTISRPPYKRIWNTALLQNQLYTGVGILAEATISGGGPQVARQEGVFLAHNPIKRKSIPIPYLPDNTPEAGNEAYAQTFPIKETQRAAWNAVAWNAWSAMAWNEKELSFYVSVKDPSFYKNQPGRNIADVGLEVMIDPARKRAPHPTDSTLFFVVPLDGTPQAIHHRTEIADGAFKLLRQRSRINYAQSISVSEFKGYNIRFSIPREAFGKAMPDTFGYNMAIRLFDTLGNVQRVALSGDNVYEMYSPFSWNDCYRLPKSLLMNSALQWGVFSTAGFLLALAAYALIARMRKPQLVSNFERSEEAKATFERVNAIIEQELIRKELKIDYVASKCGMDQQTLNTLIKRNTGFNFTNYLQYCRSEVAKERLRSSRSTETSIADLCGFDSAIEMERCFAKFYHTTPYKYRAQQQVA